MNIGGLMMLGLLAGIAAMVMLWSYGLVFALLCAPFIASLVTLLSAVLLALRCSETVWIGRGRKATEPRINLAA